MTERDYHLGVELIRWLREEWSEAEEFAEVRESGCEGDPLADQPRVDFAVDEHSTFFAEVIPGEAMVRVGLSCASREINEIIEQAVIDSGGGLDGFLEEGMDAEEKLEYPVRHFSDNGVHYFCSEIPYVQPGDMGLEDFREEILYYLQGYHTTLWPYLEE